MPTEKTITAAIIKYLKSLPNCWHIKVFGGPRGRAGVPDLLVCRRGLFYAIEVKVPGGKGPTKLQERELAAIMKAGALAFTARSVADVRRVMDAERRTIAFPKEQSMAVNIVTFEERLKRYIVELELYERAHYSRGKAHYVGKTLLEALADLRVLLDEIERLTEEIDLLTPPEHPTVADCASTITGITGGEDGD